MPTATDQQLQDALDEIKATQRPFWDALLALEQLLWQDDDTVSLSSETDYSNWTLDEVKALANPPNDDDDLYQLAGSDVNDADR